jgi:hypothetical protein
MFGWVFVLSPLGFDYGDSAEHGKKRLESSENNALIFYFNTS